jgi:nucleotide-binding universal stress UspA family protein
VTLLHTFAEAHGLCGASEGAFTAVFDVAQMEEESCAMLGDFFPPEPGDTFQIFHSATCGDPAGSIVNFARQNQVDLIMLPTRGHGIFHRTVLGSVTSTILESAPCPVWTAAHTEDPAMPSHAGCRTIVLAVSGAPEEAQTIRRAADVCEAFSEKLLLLHGLKDPVGAEGARIRIGDLQRTAHTNLELAIEAGDPVEAVPRFAGRQNADLLILGPGALRASAQEIIRNARCPVLSL